MINKEVGGNELVMLNRYRLYKTIIHPETT